MNLLQTIWIVAFTASCVIVSDTFAADTMPLDTQFRALPEDMRNVLSVLLASQVQSRKATESFNKQVNGGSASDKTALLKYVADLTYLSFHGPTGVQTDEDRWASGMVVLSLPRDIVLDAIVPEMNEQGRMNAILLSGDQDLRRHLEGKTDGSRTSIDDYLSYLERHGLDEAGGLVRYLFEAYPEQAFVGIVAVRSSTLDQRAILAAHHEMWAAILISEQEGQEQSVVETRTRKAVEDLSRHKEWWIRLYIAVIIRRHPEISDIAVSDRLRKDSHPLVRDAVHME